MSRQALKRSREVVEPQHPPESDARPVRTLRPKERDVAGMLARMTFEERARAYKNRVFTRRELFVAAAREPERMPMLNGEFEWIAFDLADLDD